MTFFGVDPAGVEKEREKLDTAIEEAKQASAEGRVSGKAFSFEDFAKEVLGDEYTEDWYPEEEQERDVFCVRSFGFDNQGFMEFYRKLRWIVPGRTRIIGTKTQEVWKLRRPNIGICTAAGMLLGYVLPKLLEMMMYG
jgi:hypothetical protein